MNTTPAAIGADALREAERLLRRDADSLREGHTAHRDRDDWTGEPDAKAGYDEYVRAADGLAALASAAQPPAGFVLVPVELAERIQETMGEFLMDHGWRQQDMDAADDFGALLAAAPKAEPAPAGEYPALPPPARPGDTASPYPAAKKSYWSEAQMYEAIDADRAMRAQAAPAEWLAPVRELLGHIDDALDDTSFEKIDTKKWNAVSALVGVAGAAQAAPAAVACQYELEASLGRTIEQRDTAEGWADGLADLIGKYFGQEIGEHSSAHNPWQEAKDIIEEAGPYKPAAVAGPNDELERLRDRIARIGRDVDNALHGEVNTDSPLGTVRLRAIAALVAQSATPAVWIAWADEHYGRGIRYWSLLEENAHRFESENPGVRCEPYWPATKAAPQPAAPQESARLDWFLEVQPTADKDGLGHFITAWLAENKSPTGVAGYFVTRGGSHRECIDKHIAREGVEAAG